MQKTETKIEIDKVHVNNKMSSDFVIWLQREFSKRCKKNPKYSLRAFARFLKTDPSTVSQILSRKRKASVKNISKMCSCIGVEPAQEQKFYENQALKTDSYIEMKQDVFSTIADWYHIAILELSQTQDFDPTPKLIARQLGITATEVQAALDRLIRLGLLVWQDDFLIRTQLSLTNFSPGITSPAHKLLQSQIITKALDAIEGCEQMEKDITSIFMSIDESKLPEARKMIEDFRKKMCAFLENGNQTRVYNMAVQLFPLSNKLNRIDEDSL